MNWRKATYSSSGGSQCVEVASVPGTIMVRDTTNREGFTLGVSAASWRAFVTRMPELTDQLS